MSKRYDATIRHNGNYFEVEVHRNVEDQVIEASGHVLPWLILAALAVVFLPFYCAFRIADPSTRVLKIILHLCGILIGLGLLSSLLESIIDESARSGHVEVVGWVTILLLVVPFVVRFLRARSAH